MSFRGRPSLSGTPGRSSLEPSPRTLDLAKLRADLLLARDLPCFQTRPECQSMIDDVLTSCLPVAAMAESTAAARKGTSAAQVAVAAAGEGERAEAPAVDTSGVHLPRAPPALGTFSPPPSTSATAAIALGDNSSMDWDPAPNPKQTHLAGPLSSSRTSSFSSAASLSIGGGTVGSGAGAGANGGGGRTGGGGVVLPRRGSGSVYAERVGIMRMPDRAWTIVLDYLDLGEGMRCRQLGRVFRDTVEASLSVLALSGVNSITWATPENLAFLTRFKNVRTLHWYVGVGMPSKVEDAAASAASAAALAEVEEPEHAAAVAAEDEGAPAMGAAGGVGKGAVTTADRFGAAAGEKALRVADCCPVRAWSFLLGALPKIEEVIIVEGAETDEIALEQVWLHLLPLVRNLRSFFLNFEDYSQCPVDGDHPPINVKKFAVFLQAKKPFPKLRELHLELGSMSIAEQRSLIRGLSSSGLLPQLEKVTLGDGTTSYVRNSGRGPGRDLFAAFRKNPCVKLKVLWLQRLDLWDDLDSLASALGPACCPVLEELFLDLALDTDDVARLAGCLHKFPASLKTLGVLAVAIKNRTPDGTFDIADPKPALQLLADSLSKHPRPSLQCLDVSLHYEREEDEGALLGLGEPPQPPLFKARTAAMPIMELLGSGKLAGLKHVQLSSCSLDDSGLAQACASVAKMKGIQTLDLSSNKLSVAGSEAVAEALRVCRSLHEIVLEESVDIGDGPAVSAVFKDKMPWAIVRVDDQNSRKSLGRRSLAAGEHDLDNGAPPFDQGPLSDGEDDDLDEDDGHPDSQAGDDHVMDGDAHHWEAIDAESDGEVPLELMAGDDSDEDM
ncbi:unnamed protein product [Scytosiphon promiscuus]